jgi:hypothetical protein
MRSCYANCRRKMVPQKFILIKSPEDYSGIFTGFSQENQ